MLCERNYKYYDSSEQLLKDKIELNNYNNERQKKDILKIKKTRKV